MTRRTRNKDRMGRPDATESSSGRRETKGEGQAGTLSVVATPIGNLGDMTARAADTLRNADLVLAEDTRSFRVLADRFGITVPVQSYHEHNEQRRTREIVPRIESGERIALVSEAGTPTISDPGYRLVRACREAGIEVSAVPGPCAAIAALSVSGFETDRFAFLGFLPLKHSRRVSALRYALDCGLTTIFYESPFRIVKTLEALAALEPRREIFLARELTKIYEETLRGEAQQVLQDLSSRPKIKGEFVLIIRALGRHHTGVEPDEDDEDPAK